MGVGVGWGGYDEQTLEPRAEEVMVETSANKRPEHDVMITSHVWVALQITNNLDCDSVRGAACSHVSDLHV